MPRVLLIIAIIALVFVVFVATRPTEFRISRSATLDAPPNVVFAQVNDFSAWQAWSPWARLDPAAENFFAGPKAGKGAVFKWSGNSEVGEGMMTIIESQPDDLIVMRLEFNKPFRAINVTEFAFKPEGERTAVTWSMAGNRNFIAKMMGLFVNVDQMVGGQFEKGLANLSQAAKEAALKEPEEEP
jgi:hypothetical protein